ncbi:MULTISPECIES: 50S ribosomal protein L11 methyltransferase [Brevibacillus]|uniref:Ribosomal protein L11 methyltransferase n=1 Tax=Brevibacillus invocatus TaxID=173959 RepID=A0A3M8C7E6_9BACL|nr:MULTISPECIES: 50S ribosomal protein L11 methyltransferase [Brevibacillus]MCM3078197.1 50S ribosomal protein L11 methyltransferase [Brevibacillus invocatus]MCM3428218.1 50S ribosomal protein L11 methyltransferase [Brevibacillus invocatus]MDH4617701.1 50S ribosomal protein L11 methyltransferase [Brevibacillus sp. AY1]RNB71622.1 methyltransferase domain-containing protein [Brevibacillus invocatus]
MEQKWLKYTLKVRQDTEDIFVAELLDSPYTLGWVEPPFEVLTTDNGYDFAQNTEDAVTVYVFEPMVQQEEEHQQLLRVYIQRWPGAISILEVAQVAEENESWKDEFREVQVGDWWIAPTWTEPEALKEAKHILWMDPGAAFGTGYHGTTQDILLFLQEITVKDKVVLDIGAGSGILSLYCAINGASQPVYAVDINPQSEYQMEVNAANNQLPAHALKIIVGDALEDTVRRELPQQADLILLNIGGDEDVAMLPIVKERIAPDGYLLLSGMVEWNREMVRSTYEQAGFQTLGERQSEEWVTLLMKESGVTKK